MLMFQFLKIQRTDFPHMEPYWVLYISTPSELMDFLKLKESVITCGFIDVKENARIESDDYSKRSGGSSFDMLGSLIVRQIRNSSKKFNNIVEEFEYLGDMFTLPIIKAFNQFGEILVNETFGFCVPQGIRYKILDIDKSEFVPITKSNDYDMTMTFPYKTEKQDAIDVKYVQWSHGIHWYVKIGNDDVVWNGEQKWDTKEDAMRIAKLYAQKHQIKIRNNQ